MKYYAVSLSALAEVSTTVRIFADSEEDAKNKIFDNELWNDSVWDYQGLSDLNDVQIIGVMITSENN